MYPTGTAELSRVHRARGRWPLGRMLLVGAIGAAGLALTGCEGTSVGSATVRASPTDPSRKPPPMTAVHFHELRQFLPREISGLRSVRDEGSTGRYGEVAISEAERSFAGDEAELTFRIVDSSMGERLASSIRETLAEARGKNAPQFGLQPLEGMVGYVRYDPHQDQTEVNLLVADRYVVAIVGHGFGSSEPVRAAVAGVDFAGLSRLR